ncbi:hypothetical protein [Legionella waltersii]|uniref:Phage minor tail protein n=1 Tax=Legionella waltersii TaxID=66969 RepID=A0A0W1A5G2_9GAMM|nr:hypothetical protein [Legionella waltersii]KTD76505.1 phage minor tail protein [Legionella waltersii]SNU93800.1 phage minor tail protein [Legionella waltersii]
MFISQLRNKLETYDKYKIHRINGLKAVYILYLMILLNLFSNLVNPYFYFFYVPLTCFTVESAGKTLQEKYLFLLYALLGVTLSIFLFGVLSVYKLLFLFFTFFYALFLYFLVLNSIKSMLAIVPLMLSLASYSLIYGTDADSNFYIACNHALQTLMAMVVIFAGLYFFPNKYYYDIWMRAKIEVVNELTNLSKKIAEGEVKTIPIFPSIILMERYSKMLPKHLKTYSILRITLLSYQLVLTMSYLFSFQDQIPKEKILRLHNNLERLAIACKEGRAVVLTPSDQLALRETHELHLLYRLMLSWNYLCANG